MPFEATWLLDKRVIYFRAYGSITATDAAEITKIQIQHHDEGIAPVHTIVDMQSPSIQVASFLQIRQVGFTPLHPKTGWMVMLGSERGIVSFGTSMIIQMIGSKHFKVAKSLSQAVEFLNHNDATLNLTLEEVQAYIDTRIAITES
ncbi:MAG: hypothetical protein IAE80_14490 [Anaerolinea sp.]|nr:hypothetical protein [Anaerolinea sp.]